MMRSLEKIATSASSAINSEYPRWEKLKYIVIENIIQNNRDSRIFKSFSIFTNPSNRVNTTIAMRKLNILMEITKFTLVNVIGRKLKKYK